MKNGNRVFLAFWLVIGIVIAILAISSLVCAHPPGDGTWSSANGLAEDSDHSQGQYHNTTVVHRHYPVNTRKLFEKAREDGYDPVVSGSGGHDEWDWVYASHRAPARAVQGGGGDGGLVSQAIASSEPEPTPEPEPKPIVKPPPPPPKSNIVLTQVMFHDWTSAGGGNLPQWFELHNRGGDGNLKGFQLTFFIKGGDKRIILLKDYPFAAGETLIVSRKRVGHFLGHLWGHSQGVEKVYIDETIPNLKNNWVLTDPSGKELYRRDAYWNWGWGEHERGTVRDTAGRKHAYRRSVDVIPSEPYTGQDPIYYGNRWDAGNPPGYHVDVAPKAPSLVRPKLVTLWGILKQ